MKKSYNLCFRFILVLTLCINADSLLSQVQLFQTVKGKVVDQLGSYSLIGVNVVLLDHEKLIGTVTDDQGYFRLENVPIGRQSLKFTYLGYEDFVVNNILINSSKEIELLIELKEKYITLSTAVITDAANGQALNEMASLSSKSFSVEETQRYAASAFDPARMASSFAGVVNSGDDVNNEISIRGNSPKGMLWRIEGIEVPSPNHFGDAGGSGGGISMLSSSTLSNSDFYTGAFPAEFGNAISGVFDLKFRVGNKDKREHSIMLGILGTEISSEGYINKRLGSSYLINYRYSTLELIKKIGFNITGNDVLPAYQDLSFNFNFPTTKLGTFSMFGIGGKNSLTLEAERDSSKWKRLSDNKNFIDKQQLGIIGIKHFKLINKKNFIKTIFSISDDNTATEGSIWDVQNGYRKDINDVTNFQNLNLRLTTLLNIKLNSTSTLRTGIIASYISYDFDFNFRKNNVWLTYLDGKGSTFLSQIYLQYQKRISEKLTVNAGCHYTYLFLNNTSAFDPRLSFQYGISKKSTLSFSIGLQSKPEHISTYLLKKTSSNADNSLPNRNLKMTNSLQGVLGYKNSFKGFSFNTEIYYQYHYNVPISADRNSTFSILNAPDIFSIIDKDTLVNRGEGFNYGLDITIQKPLGNQYYVLLSGSIYSSKYKAWADQLFNTKYNKHFSINALLGKEFVINKSRNKIIGVNFKLNYGGGNRYYQVNLEESIKAGEEVLNENNPYSVQAKEYFRMDIGFSFKINKFKLTHSFYLDIQNLSNNPNVLRRRYDKDSQSIIDVHQAGLFPYFNYRLEF